MPIPALATIARTALAAGNAIQGGQVANAMFSKWFPSLDIIAEVEVQGEKTTPAKATLHSALAIAFGMVDTTRLAEIELHTEFDHVNNRVHVHFGMSSGALLFIINALSQVATSYGRAVLSDAGPLISPLGGAIWAAQRIAGNNAKNADNIVGVMNKLLKEGVNALQTSKIWDTPRDDILGGVVPLVFRDFKDRNPMDQTKDQIFLTRSDAINPQPPGADGLDLRSLVAQVLHDPGVRPPLPRTDAGPPVQDEDAIP